MIDTARKTFHRYARLFLLVVALIGADTAPEPEDTETFSDPVPYGSWRAWNK